MKIFVYICLIEVTFLFSFEYNVQDVLPFLVKIEAKNKILDCAGTIISSCVALTSAHCIEGVHPFDVTVSHVAERIHKYETALIIIHPDYKTKTLGNDIGLLKIVKNFEKPWTPVTLNSVGRFNVFPECSFFQIVGWSGQITRESVESEGKQPAVTLNFTDKPMTATVKLISSVACAKLIKKFGGTLEGNEKLCGMTKDDETEEWGHGGCFAGPGGPLLCSVTPQGSAVNSSLVRNSVVSKSKSSNESETLDDPIDLLANFRKNRKIKRKAKKVKNLQVGVISWGKSCSKVPSVYVRTDLYYAWIKESVHEMMTKDKRQATVIVLTPPSQNSGPTLTIFAFHSLLICFPLIVSLVLV